MFAIQAPSLGRERPLVGAPRVGGNHCSPLAVLLPACSVLAFTSAGYRLLAGMFFVCWNPDHWGSSLTLATRIPVCVCGLWDMGISGHAWVRRSFPRTRRAAAVEGEPVESRPAGPGTGTVWLVRGSWSFYLLGGPCGEGPPPWNLGDRVNGRCGRVR